MDHPRSRGVYRYSATPDGPWHGSSPLARGLLHTGPHELLVRGIIPARAGFTDIRYQRIACYSDHPRSRGVYPGASRSQMAYVGSSPLARGLHGQALASVSLGRIIPARAGFTTPSRRGLRRPGDHPRSRGVYCLSRSVLSAVIGSSPLARGLPRGTAQMGQQWRIIPARAGFTWSSSASPPVPADHPRSRGVYRTSLVPSDVELGSSPLARGLHADGAVQRQSAGIIPARAGFTTLSPRASLV